MSSTGKYSHTQNVIRLSNWKIVIFLSFLIVSSVLVRLPFFSVPMITDEGGYAYVAHFWTNSYQLYRDIPFDRPQGIFLLYKFILTFFGNGTENIRFFAAVFNALTLTALFFLAWEIISLKVAWATSVTYAIFSACPSIEGFTANAELFVVLPLTLAAYLTWKERWIWVGIISGLAFLLKPIGISGFVLAFLWMIYVRTSWREFVKLTASFAIFPILSIIHGILIGWEHYWYSFVEQKATSDTIFSIGFARQINAFSQSILKTLPALAILWILAALGLFFSKKRIRIFGLCWLLCSLIGMSIGGNWFRHYYVQLIPILAFLSGIGLIRAYESSHRWRWELALAIPIIFFGVAEAPYWFYSPKDVSFSLYKRTGYLVSEDVAKFIQSNTSNRETIYVAFAQADFYYLSRRRAAVPQLYYYQVKGSKKVFQKVMNCIQTKTPSLVIWCQPPPSWISKEGFRSILENGYSEMERIYFYKWVEDRLISGNVIIFKRKDY